MEGDDVFLLADKNLDVQRYNDTRTAVTWENCTMRSWLNGYGAEKNKAGKDCYSTSRKWKNKKQKPVFNNKTVIKKLKKKKTYYFRVRAYRLEGKKKVYGSWSGTKKIKIKK